MAVTLSRRGYDLSKDLTPGLQDREVYLCSKCRLVMRDPVQSLCGHRFCEGCITEVWREDRRCSAHDCNEELPSDYENGKDVYFYPDHYLRKKLNGLTVNCKHSGCTWKGAITKWELHIGECSLSLQTCSSCDKQVFKKEMEDHERNCPKALRQCILSGYGCLEQKMEQKELQRHYLSEQAKHLKIILSLVQGINKSGNIKLRLEQPEAMLSIMSADSGFSSVGKSVHGDEQPDGEGRLHSIDIKKLQSQMKALEKNVEIISTEKNTLESKVLILTRENDSLSLQVTQFKEKLAKTEKTMEDLTFRMMMEEAHSFNGHIIWRIPSFGQRQQEAKSGKFTSIYSLPFYTSRYGYKMCLRLYPFGDGAGRGSHLSLFLVIMKGEYDEILEWPFKHKVTFSLLNQKGSKDIVDAFRADPQSSSFRKPVSDMNVATGCPKLAALDTLEERGFVLNDVIFIRAQIDSFNGSKLGPR